MSPPDPPPGDGSTPIDPNESAGLRLDYITTRDELNAAEQDNILTAQRWAVSRKRPQLLTDTFLRELHRRMFGQVWDWAGRYRTTDKSIGLDWNRIPIEVSTLCEDTKHWSEHASYDWTELAARFHHRLVLVHPFPNGNGRHARLATDLLLRLHDQAPLSWGTNSPRPNEVRARYLAALRAADAKHFAALIAFVRS